ncbi:MAG TPA: ABC transporter permease, partial [Terracidiphilus sp.]|nr:ABC transporter permease [Terracidiphilus sp.]
MRFLRVAAAKAMGLLTLRRSDLEMDAEIRAHLDLLTERYIGQGMSREDAARAARLQFGNVTLLKERQRAQRSFLSAAEWWGDLRFGLRMLLKKPGANAAVVLALALGIGMNAAVFSFVNALLLRPPAGVSATGKLLEIWMHNRTAPGVQGYLPFTYSDYAYFRDHSRSLDVMAFDGDGHPTIWNRSGAGQVIQGQLVSGNYFSELGVNASLGRMLSNGDDQLTAPHPVVVLSHSFWERELNADPGIVGRTLVLNGAAFTVVGVAPAGFTGMLVAMAPDFWAPLTKQEQFTHDKGRISNRDSNWLILVGRLGTGMDKAKAQAEMHLLAHQLELNHPDSNKNLDAVVYPATLVPGPYRGYVSAFTGMLQAVFVLVLLIACANAASLLLARAQGRVREMAIRSALGAGRARLIRQMLAESLLLSSIAGVAGVQLAWWLARMLLELKPASLPINLEVPMDWRVLLFALLVSLATGVIFGLVPALRSAAVEAAPVLKEEGQTAGLRKSRLRNILLIGEIATCVVLLAGATLCVRSLMHANSIDPGFDTHHIAIATLDPGSLGYSPEKVSAFYRQMMDHVLALPGVTAASYADYLPLGTSDEVTSVGEHIGNESDRSRTDVFRVDAGYFSAMGIAVLRGRGLTQKEADASEPGAVVVNEVLARQLWPGQDPIGKRIALGGAKSTSEVVGVAKAGKYRTLGEGPMAVVYRGQLPPSRTLVIRTSGDARLLLEPVRREVQVVDPMMAATDLETIGEYMALPLFPARTLGLLLGASGIFAAVLTAIGLFGVIAYVVSQRTHEIGVRMALGARHNDILKLVMRQGLQVTLIGLCIGLAA